MSADGNFMNFKLYNGVRYEEFRQNVRKSYKTYELARTEFKEYEMLFDLSNFDFNRTDDELFKNNYRMLSVRQLLHGVDSIENKIKDRNNDFSKNLKPYFSFIKEDTFSFDEKRAAVFRWKTIT